MTVYKLLDQNMESYGDCRWTIGRWKRSRSLGNPCAPRGYHAYEHPLLAVLHNPIHADIQFPRLFIAEAEGEIIRDGQMKLKSQRMRVVKEIPVPIITTEQRVVYAILCARGVHANEKWDRWADDWLSGDDRPKTPIWATRTVKVAGAAEAAVWAAEAAARVMTWTTAAAAWTAAEAAAAWAAETAAWAAGAAEAEVGHALNLIACAEKAIEVQGCAD